MISANTTLKDIIEWIDTYVFELLEEIKAHEEEKEFFENKIDELENVIKELEGEIKALKNN